MDTENRLETSITRQEYSANEGIVIAFKRIEELLAIQQYVVVAVIGSGTNVGKTYVQGRLGQMLREHLISYNFSSDIRGLDYLNPEYPVLILGAEYPPLAGTRAQDALLQQRSTTAGLSLHKIDLRIYVYRPDKPFNKLDATQHADIMIRNEAARNDPYNL